ncbi:MAG: ATP-binding protein [Kiloniellales bacterium]
MNQISTRDAERHRLAVLRKYEILDTPPEEAFDRITRLAAHLLRVPVALISMVDEDRQWNKSHYGLDVESLPRPISFCTHAVASERTLIVPDATRDAQFADNPFVTGEPGVRFYAGVPLRVREGATLGTLCVVDFEARDITPAERALLEDLADLVVEALELRLVSSEAMKVRDESLEARQQSDARLLRAVESMSDGFSLYDNAERLILCNSQFMGQVGEEIANDLIGKTFEEIVRLLADRRHYDGIGQNRDAWIKERLDLHRLREPHVQKQRDGRMFLIREFPTPDGGFVLTRTDITAQMDTERALRESEERFRAIVNHSPTKIHIKDAEGRYILVNPLSEKLFGATEAELKGKSTVEVFDADQAKAFRAHDQQVLDTRKPLEREEQFVEADGVHTYLTVKFPILNTAGEFMGIGAIGTDITDRKEAEARLHQSEKALQMRIAELEEAQSKLKEQEIKLTALTENLRMAHDHAQSANRAKSEFLATMSHELRTPLNAIIGFSEIMCCETLGPMGNSQYGEYAKDINESGQHLLALINDILDLSKVESGLDELNEESIDLGKLVPSVVRLIHQRAQKESVTLRLDIPNELPALRADQRKVKQVLVNLMSNAVKFTNAGGEVVLKVRADSAQGYRFQVIDTGIGIAPEDIAKAMAQFGQVHSGLTREYEGTGLGLPLAKSLVELHGGTLRLESELGVGTTVTVSFPADRIGAAEDVETSQGLPARR